MPAVPSMRAVTQSALSTRKSGSTNNTYFELVNGLPHLQLLAEPHP